MSEGDIQIHSGVSVFNGKPFCAIEVDGKRIGQMPPEDVRVMAMYFLEAAEAAEMDAIVLAELRESVGLSNEEAARFIAHLRQRRPGNSK